MENKEVIAEQYAKENSSSLEKALKDAFLEGYKSRCDEEKNAFILNPIVYWESRKWSMYNFGARCATDFTFGGEARGSYLTFDEANSIPNLRLPLKRDIESIRYQTAATRNFSNSNYPYNERIIVYNDPLYEIVLFFWNYARMPISPTVEKEKLSQISFYHDKGIANDDSRAKIKEIYDKYEPDTKFCHIWLGDEVEDEEEALSVIMPFRFRVNDIEGTVLPFEYVEIPKTIKLQAHLIAE